MSGEHVIQALDALGAADGQLRVAIAHLMSDWRERERLLLKIALNGDTFADLPAQHRASLAELYGLSCLECADGWFEDGGDPDDCWACRDQREQMAAEAREER